MMSEITNRKRMAATRPPTTAVAATTPKASSDSSAAAAAAKTVTPPSSKLQQVCKFNISGIGHGWHSAESFSVLLVPSKHGLYDLVQAVYKNTITKMTGGWTLSSSLWTLEYGSKKYAGFLGGNINEFDYDSETGEEIIKAEICDEEHPRLFADSDNRSLLTEGTKGFFSLDNEPLRFHFKLVSTNVEQIDVNDEDLMKQYPKCIKIDSSITYTARVGAEYVSTAQQIAVSTLDRKYTEFFKGMNGWKVDMMNYPNTIPAKPTAPKWKRSETEIMALFINAGWKFGDAWKSGLMFAFPHRSRASTSNKWNEFNKCPWYLEGYGDGMSYTQKIIRAKQMCKDLMEDMIEQGPPSMPMPKPKKRTRGYYEYDPKRADGYLPKRLRCKWN